MCKKKVYSILALLMIFTLTAASSQPNNLTTYTTDDGLRTYCEAYAGNPYRSGSNVYGVGYVACTTSVSTLTVVVQVRDRGNSCGNVLRETSPAATNTCYNTSYCEVTASLSYQSNKYYDTVTSGYFPGGNDFYASDCVHIN